VDNKNTQNHYVTKSNIDNNEINEKKYKIYVYKADIKSFTHNTVSTVTVAHKYLKPGDMVLIVDDFLAEGNASLGLIDLCNQAGAKVVGVAVAIEKGFQPGRKRLEELGLKVYSGANVKAFVDNKPVF
jgi:xanthine phosphoribosyltransferase